MTTREVILQSLEPNLTLLDQIEKNIDVGIVRHTNVIICEPNCTPDELRDEMKKYDLKEILPNSISSWIGNKPYLLVSFGTCGYQQLTFAFPVDYDQLRY